MSGGRGSVIGVLFGSLIMAMIPRALPLLRIDALWQNMIKGVLILIVVVVNVILQRIADRNALKKREA
jgi:rhamnose transport system permease protein